MRLPAFDVCADHDTVTIAVRGELDLLTVPELRARTRTLPDRPGPPVVVDLSGCTYLDCKGVGMLVALKHRLAEFDRRMRVLCADGTIPARLLARVGHLGVDVELCDRPAWDT